MNQWRLAILVSTAFVACAVHNVRGQEPPQLITHAGGAIELGVPPHWRVREIARGREVRLWTSPAEKPPAEARDFLWLACHVRSAEEIGGRTAISTLTERRFLSAPGNVAEVTSHVTQRIGNRRIERRVFRLPGDDHRPARHGIHTVERTEWGLLETFAVAKQRTALQAFDSAIAQVKIGSPRRRRAEVAAPLRDAVSVVGLWKAYRSRLRLSSDGRVEILFDPKPETIGRPAASTDRPRRLNGEFRADGDLLYVHWDDGSRTNYRWRRAGSRLLLTDHEGRMSLLRKLLW